MLSWIGVDVTQLGSLALGLSVFDLLAMDLRLVLLLGLEDIMSMEAPLATALTKLLINCIGLDACLGIDAPVVLATGDWGDTDSFGGLP